MISTIAAREIFKEIWKLLQVFFFVVINNILEWKKKKKKKKNSEGHSLVETAWNPPYIHASIFRIKTYDDSNSRIAEVVRAC